MPPLAIRSRPGAASSFTPLAVLGLPVSVESAGWILPYHGGFRVWVNRPGENRTLQFNVTPSREINEADSLPLVAAGAASCGESFIVTGADDRGIPVVAGTNMKGQLLWQQRIEGPPPFRWPMPGCGRNPIILWQTEPGRVEVAQVSASGLSQRTSFAVGGPPLDLDAAPNSAWAVWVDGSGVCALETSPTGARKFQLSESDASEIAVRCCADAVCIAWAQGAYAFLARKRAGQDAFEAPCRLDLGASVGGVLQIIPGNESLIHASRARLVEGEPTRILSILTGPGYQPLAIEGIVYAAATRDNIVVLLGETELIFLGRASCD